MTSTWSDGEFFDAFEDGIVIKWDNIKEEDLEKLVDTLDEQNAEAIFNELKSVIETNKSRKAIVKTTMTVLKVAVKLGMKFV